MSGFALRTPLCALRRARMPSSTKVRDAEVGVTRRETRMRSIMMRIYSFVCCRASARGAKVVEWVRTGLAIDGKALLTDVQLRVA